MFQKELKKFLLMDKILGETKSHFKTKMFATYWLFWDITAITDYVKAFIKITLIQQFIYQYKVEYKSGLLDLCHQ